MKTIRCSAYVTIVVAINEQNSNQIIDKSNLSQNVKQIKIKYSNIIKRILISSGFMHIKISKVCAFTKLSFMFY